MEMRHVQRELLVPERDIVIHLKKKLLLTYTIFCTVIFTCCIGLWIYAWQSVSGFIPSDPANALLEVGSEILVLAFLPLIAAFGWWVAWLVIRPLFSRTPILVISHEGLRVGKLPLMTGDLFVHWEEIRSIYVRDGRRSQYLCVLLKDTDRYLSRLNRLKQFGLRFQMFNGAILNLPVSQLWLDRPAGEIIHMVSETYTHELDEYRV